MKILFTGGVTGGHFYPIIAIAKEIRRISDEEHILPPELYFMAPDPYDERLLFENDITYLKVSSGKIRKYFSFRNLTDIFKTAIGVIKATYVVFSIYPDIVFGKGGFGSFPALFAARILNIPVFIHESDSIPGRVNAWASKFAKRIALSYPEAEQYFDKSKTALTGQPVRADITTTLTEGAHEFLNLEKDIPTILILGGSQGAEVINNAVIDTLPVLLDDYQIIHQTGVKNFKDISGTAGIAIEGHIHQSRYHPMPYLNALALRMGAGVADLIITRAGSTLFEVAIWAKPSIVIPIPETVSHDQLSNAFSYARSGAGIVIEEKNLTPHIFQHEIERILNDKNLQEKMKIKAKEFAKPDAAKMIARELLSLSLTHEK